VLKNGYDSYMVASHPLPVPTARIARPGRLASLDALAAIREEDI